VWDDDQSASVRFNRDADRCLLPEEITLYALEGAKCFHYGSITFLDKPAASTQQGCVAREKGLMITYDPKYRSTLSPNEETAHRLIMDGFKYAVQTFELEPQLDFHWAKRHARQRCTKLEVQLMREIAGNAVGVKAAAGISE
jgi:fructokinase